MKLTEQLQALRDHLERASSASRTTGSGWTYDEEVVTLDTAIAELARLKNGGVMSGRVIFAMERERRELCCEIAQLKMSAIADEARRGPIPV